MAYTMGFDSKKDLAKQYQEKLVSADEAVKCVKSGDWVTYAFFNGKPIACDIALAKRKDELEDVLVAGAVTIPPVPAVLTMDPKGETFNWICDEGYSLYLDKEGKTLLSEEPDPVQSDLTLYCLPNNSN